MTTVELPLDEWRLLLAALCAGSPAWIGTLGPPDRFRMIHPTRFGWLAAARWHPPSGLGAAGIALLELAEPATVPAAAWEPLCGPLAEAPATRDGRTLFGSCEVPGTGKRATLTLITDWAADPATALVRDIRIRIEPA
jgi:hypothetical protein